jgi:phage tail sheath protein FI
MNTILIKHGNGVPNKVLEPYELGYSIDKKSLYIGAPLVNGQKTDAIPVTAEIVEKAKKLEAERTISVNLAANTSEAFDGSKDVSLGVAGILPLKNGGLGVDAS